METKRNLLILTQILIGLLDDQLAFADAQTHE